jgi:hypothetical protein
LKAISHGSLSHIKQLPYFSLGLLMVEKQTHDFAFNGRQAFHGFLERSPLF